jgi:hypothetical protein
VDNERALRIEFRRALDEVLPPAPWLEAAVKEDLRTRRSRSSLHSSPGKPQPGWLTRRGGAMQLAAGGLIVVLAAAAVAAFLDRSFSARNVAPAAMDAAAYQAMASRDVNNAVSAASGTDCTTVQSNCLGPGKVSQTAFRQWLDDLNRSKPPAVFAAIDAEMRHHLAAAIADLDGILAAYAAKDQTALDRDDYLLTAQGEWVTAIATSISQSHQGTVASYVESAQAGKQGMALCNGCRPLQLAGQDCTEIQTLKCEADVVYAELDIESLASALVTVTAPSALADQDALLQRDLAQADAGVIAMATAQLTGDPAGFNTGRVLFGQSLPAIDADLAGILGA